MTQEWFYSKDGQSKEGPFSSAELLALAKSGRLLVTDSVWKQGMSKWTVASRIKGLFDNLASPSNPTPMPGPALLRFYCPMCNHSYDVPHADSGKKFPCQKCGQRIQVPIPAHNKTVLGMLPEEIVTTQAVDLEMVKTHSVMAFPKHDPVDRHGQKEDYDERSSIRERQEGRGYRCWYCQTTSPPVFRSRIAMGGWVGFGIFLFPTVILFFLGLVFCFPLLLGLFTLICSLLCLLIRGNTRVCPECNSRA